ncbi:MAG: hypothetical protein RBT65_12495 [Methanolobus sp.]|nr:hypothetical protein [Methanolobus sp.]
MKKEKPLFGSVSLYRIQWTVNYESNGICDGVTKTGSSKDVFDGCPKNMPIIRFDLYDDVKIWDFFAKNFLPKEMYINTSSKCWNYVSTEDFLNIAKEHGIPVINLCDCDFDEV